MARLLLLALCWRIFLHNAVSSINYCDKALCPNETGPHLACNNDGKFNKTTCPANAKIITIGNSLAKYILREHNVIRNRVASGKFRDFPAARRMLTLKWSAELASMADLSVKTCTLTRHSCYRTESYAYAGQNEAYNKYRNSQDQMKIIRAQIKAWYEEYYYVAVESLFTGVAPGKQEIGRFLQMILGTQEGLGCAIARYSEDGWTYQLMKCLYSCSHKYCRTTYEIGRTPAEGCETGRNPTYPSLCSEDEDLPCDLYKCCNRPFRETTKRPPKNQNQKAERIMEWALTNNLDQNKTSKRTLYEELLQQSKN